MSGSGSSLELGFSLGLPGHRCLLHGVGVSVQSGVRAVLWDSSCYKVTEPGRPPWEDSDCSWMSQEDLTASSVSPNKQRESNTDRAGPFASGKEKRTFCCSSCCLCLKKSIFQDLRPSIPQPGCLLAARAWANAEEQCGDLLPSTGHYVGYRGID